MSSRGRFWRGNNICCGLGMDGLLACGSCSWCGREVTLIVGVCKLVDA